MIITSDDATSPAEQLKSAAGTGGDLPVIIAGGGIGGLAAALALARQGITCHVLERRDGFEQDGAGIQIGPNGCRILKELGAFDDLAPLAGFPDAIRVRSGISGETLAKLPLGEWIEKRHGAPYIVAHRQHLHGALLKRATEDSAITISTDIKIVRTQEEEQRVVVHADSGAQYEGRVLIGADGIWSRTRERIGLSSQLAGLGKSAARTVIDAGNLPNDISANDVTLWLSTQGHVVHYPVRGGEQLAIVVIADDRESSRSWNTGVHRNWVLQQVDGLAAPLESLLAQTSTWRKWALREQEVSTPYFYRGRIALLGDAAHPILPFLAQGAVLALEDAVVLADCLAGAGRDVEDGLREYDELRRPRAQQIARASKRNGQIYHLSGALARARDMTLRHAPAERLMAQYDWVYGWRI